MLEHVFQIRELVVWVLELDELSSGWDVSLRSKAVRDPKLRGHDDSLGCRMGGRYAIQGPSFMPFPWARHANCGEAITIGLSRFGRFGRFAV